MPRRRIARPVGLLVERGKTDVDPVLPNAQQDVRTGVGDDQLPRGRLDGDRPAPVSPKAADIGGQRRTGRGLHTPILPPEGRGGQGMEAAVKV